MEAINKSNLTSDKRRERIVRIIYEVCFVIHMVTVFAFYEVTGASPVTAILLFSSSLLILVTKGRRKITIPFITIWYALFIIYCILSLLWADYVYALSLSFFTKMLMIFLTSTSVAIYVDDSEDLERLMLVFIFSSLIITALEFFTTPLSDWFNGDMGSNFSSNNVNDITLWIVSAELMAFYKAYVKGKKMFCIPMIIFFGFAILSSSRKALFMGTVGPMLLVVASVYKKHYFIRLFAALILVGGLMYFIMTNEETYAVIGRRLETMFEYYFEDNVKSDSSIVARNYLARVARELFESSPLIGRGILNFSCLFESDYGSSYVYAHNNYWQLLSELGIIGLVIYYSLYLLCAVRFLKQIIKTRSRLCVLFMILLLLFLIAEKGIISAYSKYSQLIIAMIFTATYADSGNGRKYNFISRNADV